MQLRVKTLLQNTLRSSFDKCFSRVQIENAGDSSFIIGDVVSKATVVEENKILKAEGKKPAEFKQQLLGITKVSDL